MSARAPMLVLELNEATEHFLRRYVAEGELPHFARLLAGGRFLRTRIAGWRADADRAWRHISPWMVWPSVYTGLPIERHGIVGFGQDSRALQGACIWDRLNAAGVTTGVCGNLMSWPPRGGDKALFYVPESLADTDETIPEAARPAQAFSILAARNYSESFVKTAPRAVALLLRSLGSGVSLATAARMLAQVPLEILRGPRQHPERAMLHSYMLADVFKALWTATRPAYATAQFNHIAYMQHRYWRAAEPERFGDAVGPLDRHFFGTAAERRRFEAMFAGCILRSFQLADRILGDWRAMAGESATIAVLTGLGQRPMEPGRDIHNPEIRLVRIEALFARLDLPASTCLPQMNPDLTLTFADRAAAEAAERKLAAVTVDGALPLFHQQRVGAQLFLEVQLPESLWDRPLGAAEIRVGDNGPALRLADHVVVNAQRSQSTAHHQDEGWMLVGGDLAGLDLPAESLDVTEICPLFLRRFGIGQVNRAA
ncbi:MAG: alkaline phosphatase family protein [Alphaproteobacteria bacterium]|nr:alkaline phosphatase family protein [Alphaproteobacteria bacterium]